MKDFTHKKEDLIVVGKYKATCQFKCKNNTYFHEITKKNPCCGHSILGVSALFTSKFIIKYFVPDFEIDMEKNTI